MLDLQEKFKNHIYANKVRNIYINNINYFDVNYLGKGIIEAYTLDPSSCDLNKVNKVLLKVKDIVKSNDFIYGYVRNSRI